MCSGGTVGWDIGGAHLKVAVLSADGVLLDARQMRCELWRGMDRLQFAAARVLKELDPGARHALTMTAELADLFANRASGVAAVVAAMSGLLPEPAPLVYAGRRGFVEADQIAGCVEQIASANWLATSAFLGWQTDQALLVDIGSTTTDLIPINAGRAATVSETDAERLSRDELVYTGVVRTPVCALADRVPFAGEWQGLAAELFATAADCYRLLEWLPAAADQAETADGRGKSALESARRLGRMLGRDARADELAAWRQVAAFLARRQLQRIQDAADRVLSGAGLAAHTPVVGAGVGRFLAARMAAQMDRPYRDIGCFLDGPGALTARAADCIPAVAVALLAAQPGAR